MKRILLFLAAAAFLLEAELPGQERTPPIGIPHADSSAIVIQALNFTGDTVRVYVAVGGGFTAIGVVEPQSGRMFVIPSATIGQAATVIVGFEPIGRSGAELTPALARIPGRINFIGWTIGEPPPVPKPAVPS